MSLNCIMRVVCDPPLLTIRSQTLQWLWSDGPGEVKDEHEIINKITTNKVEIHLLYFNISIM